MDAAAWVTAGATVALALSVPVAWFTWLNVRRQDRQRAQQEREEEARRQVLEDASKKFVSKESAQSLAAVAILGGILGAVAWFGREKP